MKKLLPPVYFLVAILVMVALHRLLPGRRLVEFPWRLAGAVPMALGIVLIILVARLFKRHHTTIKPFQESAALVTEGPFRLSRNPVYLGMLLSLMGIGAFMGTLTPWLAIPVLAVLLDVVFIRAEEQMLEHTFGDAYREYRRRVRRWI